MSFFISESGQSIEEAEEALALVRARKERAAAAPQGLVDDVDNKEQAARKRELQVLQVTHAETVHELEKTRALLGHQDGISKQQQQRAERWQRKVGEMEREMDALRKEFDDALTKKSNRIAALEAQIRDVAYGTHQCVVQLSPSHLANSGAVVKHKLLSRALTLLVALMPMEHPYPAKPRCRLMTIATLCILLLHPFSIT